MTRRSTVAALVVGLLLALLPVGWWLTRPGTVGQDEAVRLAASTPPTDPAPGPLRTTAAPGAAGSGGASSPPGGASSPPGPASAAVPATRPSRPVPAGAPRDQPTQLSIPGLGVDAQVVPVGVDPATGEMQVPQVVDVVGWYRFGPGLGERAGSTVIAGHVDAADQGRGAFFRLRELRPGQRFTVAGGDGRVRGYRVVSREVYAKTKAPLSRVFARDGAPRLTLVTCGGSFDRSTRSYRDNIVVTAVEEAR